MKCLFKFELYCSKLSEVFVLMEKPLELFFGIFGGNLWANSGQSQGTLEATSGQSRANLRATSQTLVAKSCLII